MTTIIQAPNTHTYTEVDLLNKIRQINIHSSGSEEIAKRLLNLSRYQNYRYAIIESYCALGYIYTLQAEYKTARTSFSKAQVLLEDLKASLPKVQKQRLQLQLEGGIGNTYALQTSLALALPHYYKALKIAEELENTQQISNYLGNIGTIHVKNLNPDKGLVYFMRAKELLEKENLTRHLDTVYSNIASCFFDKGLQKETLIYLQKALDIASETKNKNTISVIYNNYADLYALKKEYDIALQYIKEAILIRKETVNPEGLMRAYITKARIYKETHQYEKSKKIIEKALAIAISSDLKEGQESSYRLLADLYKSTNDFEKSCEYLEKHIEVRNQISNDKAQKIVADLTLKYESEKKDFEIRQLHQQQKLLNSKNEELKLFASKASHDMKEPLRMIGSFSGLLKKRHCHQLDASALEYLNIIENANKRMNQLLSDLLDYTVAGANTQVKQEISLNEIMHFVQQNLQLAIEEKNAIIEVENLPILKGHQTDMMQLFQNLVSNAIKFCDLESPFIRVTARELKNDWEIAVHDNGIGISTENQFKIFDIFTRLHSRQEYEGTGIGLAICKKIVQQYDGEIWVESELGKGTSFYFTLPIT